MKRNKALVVLLVIAMLLTGCGNGSGTQSNAGNGKTAVTDQSSENGSKTQKTEKTEKTQKPTATDTPVPTATNTPTPTPTPHEHSYVETYRIDSTYFSEGHVLYRCECGDTYSETLHTKKLTIDKQTINYGDYYKITTNETWLDTDERTGHKCIMLNILVENLTSDSEQISIQLYLNGTNCTWNTKKSCNVGIGEKMYVDVPLLSDYDYRLMNFVGIDIQEIGLYLARYSDWSYKDSTYVTLSTNETNVEEQPGIQGEESENIVYDENGIRFIYKGMADCTYRYGGTDYHGKELFFIIENNSDQEISTGLTEMSVNGFKYNYHSNAAFGTRYYYESVSPWITPGKKTIYSVIVPDGYMDSIKCLEIESLKLKIGGDYYLLNLK